MLPKKEMETKRVGDEDKIELDQIQSPNSKKRSLLHHPTATATMETLINPPTAMETLPSNGYRPWSDLPDDFLDAFLEAILERLPISDYARFAAVCRRWRSAQTSHRRLHSPSPPPMLRLPWVIIDPEPLEGALSFYSPFQNEFFPKFPAVPSDPCLRSFADCGWLLMLSEEYGPYVNIFHLFNPTSGGANKIELPHWPNPNPDPARYDLVVGFSPPPNYTVSTIYSTSIYVFRWFDSGWVELKVRRGGLKSKQTALSINGKHYYILQDYDVSFQESFSIDLLAVDPLSSPPTFEYFEMTGRNQMMRNESGCRHRYGVSYLVESDGEPLLVKEILKCEKNHREYIVRYEVFRADLSRKIWVRAESIGDNRVLMFHGTCSVSLLAADIGATGNCICFPTKSNAAQDRGEWKMFDLRTGRVTDFMLPNALQFRNYDYSLFMPSLC